MYLRDKDTRSNIMRKAVKNYIHTNHADDKKGEEDNG